MDVLPIGAEVVLWPSTRCRVVAVIYDGNLEYKIVYWSGTSLVETWVDAALVTPTSEDRETIGFKGCP